MKQIKLDAMIAAARNRDTARNRLEFDKKYCERDVERDEQRLRDAITACNTANEALNAAIIDAEGRATARTINAAGIVDAVREINGEIGIAKTRMHGMRAEVDINAQNFPNAYRYTPESTQFTVENKRGSWYVTNIWRGTCKRASRKYVIQHTDESKAAIIERLTVFN